MAYESFNAQGLQQALLPWFQQQGVQSPYTYDNTTPTFDGGPVSGDMLSPEAQALLQQMGIAGVGYKDTGKHTGQATFQDAQGNAVGTHDYDLGDPWYKSLAEAAALASAAFGFAGINPFAGFAAGGAEAATAAELEAAAAADIAGGMVPEFGTAAGYGGFMDGAIAAGQVGAPAGMLGGIGTLPAQATSALGALSPDIPLSSLAQPVQLAGAAPALPSLLGGGGGLGSALGGLLGSGVTDALKTIMPIAGAAAGMKKQPGETSTTTSKTDPRIDPYLYGDDGILKALSSWYGQNKSGVNPTMQRGWDMQMGLLGDPNVMGQLNQMRNTGMGMMGSPMAGNGFSMLYPGG